MSNTEFVSAFRSGLIPPAAFRHEEHIRLAYSHLSLEPIDTAIASFRDSLIQFLRREDTEDKYHETITVAYLLLIAYRMSLFPERPTWEEFRSENPDFFDTSRNSLSAYYEPETLSSSRARKTFVPPDREEFPHVTNGYLQPSG